MKQKDEGRKLPTEGIWRRFWVLVPIVAVMALASWAYIQSQHGTYRVWTSPGAPADTFASATVEDVVLNDPGVVEVVAMERGVNGSVGITFRALADGATEAALVGKDGWNAIWVLEVRGGGIVEAGVNFSGWESVLVCLCLLLLVVSGLLLSVVLRLWRKAWYGYTMIAAGGGFLFTLFQAALFTFILARGSLRGFLDLAFEITEMADWFVMVSIAPVSVLALLVSLSNVSLIRHEGRRTVNLLGIAASALWFVVLYLYLNWWSIGTDMRWSQDALELSDSVIAVGMSFGVCLLLSTIVCAWLASRHVPKHGADYLVVLGCGIRADGTPSPLLAGRVNRALAFDVARTQAGDAPATFVPSGGQGPDEVVSEARSMCDYLVGKGVARERIVLEDRSATTRENMAFSRQALERHAGRDAGELSVVFSTTNYHVLRGYVCAHEAGMAVEGLGSKTKAYFWPNAFLREFAGLLAAQWKSILQVYLAIALIYVAAEYLLFIY